MTDTSADLSALAKGGRTNVFGFLLRLAARIPFLFIAGRIYGPEALGRLAYTVIVIEFAAQLATLGLKRGLAFQLSSEERDAAHIAWDALLVVLAASAVFSAFLVAFPEAMFPNSAIRGLDRIQAAIAQSLKAAKLAANSWRVTANAGVANSTLMAHVKAAETIRADLMARLPGSIGARFDGACVSSGLPDPVIAALIGVSVEQMWDIRTGGAIAPAALAAVSAFVAGEL